MLTGLAPEPVPSPTKAMHMPHGAELAHCGLFMATPNVVPYAQGSVKLFGLEYWKLQAPAPLKSP